MGIIYIYIYTHDIYIYTTTFGLEQQDQHRSFASDSSGASPGAVRKRRAMVGVSTAPMVGDFRKHKQGSPAPELWL